MSIASIKKARETLVLRMQFFCLDPKKRNFYEICDDAGLQREMADYMPIWKMACIHQYGKFWDIQEEEYEENRKAFVQETKRLYSRLLISPSSIGLDRMWYLFFATGDINALEAAYSVAGNTSAKQNLREYAADRFTTFKEEYERKIAEALERDPNYFKRHETCAGEPDDENPMLQTEDVFDRFQVKIDQANRALEDMKEQEESELKSLISGLRAESAETDHSANVQEFINDIVGPNDSDDSKTPEERDRLQKLGSRFDEIARDVLQNSYVTSGDEDKGKKRRGGKRI